MTFNHLILQFLFPSVVAKKLGSRLKIKSRRLKEGSKRLVLSVEVPVVLYQAITGQKSSRRSPLFQPVNFAGSRRLATTLFSLTILLFSSSPHTNLARPMCSSLGLCIITSGLYQDFLNNLFFLLSIWYTTNKRFRLQIMS